MIYSQFDIVKLKTTQNVKWVSGPAGRPASPQGSWSVIGSIKDKGILLLSKDETVIQIPLDDVVKIAEYDITKVVHGIRSVRSFKDLEKKEKKDGK